MIRIMLVDDHVLVREALRAVLEREAGLQVVAEAGDGATTLRLAQQHRPDVVVMDVALPGQSGIEITRSLLAQQPTVKVLGLSTFFERSVIKQMVSAGARGYISKSAAGVELVRGIRSVVEGRNYFSDKIAAMMTGQPHNTRLGPDQGSQAPLTEREIEVATLLVAGRSAPVIAAQLCIAVGTVEVHRRNLMRKLGLHTVVELTRYAFQSGLVIL
ncbi:MAG: response regulator transcription factor [Comamonadaceae bacterium]